VTLNPSLELESGRPVYRYYLAWTISGDLALELPFSGVSWSRQIRRAGSFTGNVYFETDDLLSEAFWGTMPGKMSLYVTRNGTPVWGGLVAKRGYDASSRVLQVEAVGFESYLYRRHIWHDTVQANSIDQYQVVRNLVALMQTDFSAVDVPADQATPFPDNANLGITVDPANSGKTQDTQTWLGYELKSFGDAIEDFSDNLHGFEYNIEVGFDELNQKFTKRLVFRDTPPSQLPVGEEYAGERPGLDENFFEFPGSVISLSYDDSIDDAGTRQWVTGKQPEPVGEVEQPTARAAWENGPYLATNWPLFELVESSAHSDVSAQATLDKYAATYGGRAKPPSPAWTVTVNGSLNPSVGTYAPGDWCRLVVTDPFLSQAITSDGEVTKVITKRIASFSVSVPDTEQLPETVSLTLIDEWNDSE
jgi:hypothetical protein